MAVLTTVDHDLPYPDEDDPVTEGHARIQGLAEAVDAKLTDVQGEIADLAIVYAIALGG